MKFLFEDDTFSFETLRTAGFANYFGADLGEVLATATRITDGDDASWHREWAATAARVAELGERSLAAGHRITAWLMGVSPQPAWAVRNGIWVFGVENYVGVLRTAAKYSLDGVADQIVASTPIMEGVHHTMLKGQPECVEKPPPQPKPPGSP
jgi:hypothetical protein